MRLNKYIAECGVASRRGADGLIEEGRIKVNGKSVTQPGTVIDEDNDTVLLDGKKIERVRRSIYLMLNKPKGCVSTVKDDKGRKTVLDYIDIKDKRLFPIGRLDYDSEGLLLLTNDGDLAFKLTHPSHDIPKTYIAKVEGEVPECDLAVLRKGIVLDGIQTHRAKIKLLEYTEGISRLEVTIYEGRNRQVRRMFESIGKQVVFLKRTGIGDLRLGGLSRGTYRYLTEKEIQLLKNL